MAADDDRHPPHEHDWADLQPHVRERWADLSEEDLEQIGGEHERLIDVLAERYGRSREVVEREVDEFYEGLVEKADDEHEEV